LHTHAEFRYLCDSQAMMASRNVRRWQPRSL